MRSTEGYFQEQKRWERRYRRVRATSVPTMGATAMGSETPCVISLASGLHRDSPQSEGIVRPAAAALAARCSSTRHRQLTPEPQRRTPYHHGALQRPRIASRFPTRRSWGRTANRKSHARPVNPTLFVACWSVALLKAHYFADSQGAPPYGPRKIVAVMHSRECGSAH